MSQRIGVAIIGAGKVAALHAQSLAQSNRARLVAVCDPLAERAKALGAEYGASVRTFHQILASEDVDALILATPSDLHLLQARRCVESGKHVLSEFPLFGNADELVRLFDLARVNGVRVQVAHTTHYLRPYVLAQRVLRSGRLGQPHTALYRRRLYRPGGRSPDRDWRDNALTHLGGHALDLLTWLLDDAPQQIQATARPSAREASTVGLMVGMAGGPISYISIDFESRPNAIWMEVACEKGTLAVHGFSHLEVNGQVEWQASDDDEAYHAAIAAQDQDFVKAAQGAGSDVTTRSVLHLNGWMARALRSARTRPSST